MIAEICGPSGRVHYRRSPDDPLVQEARATHGYSVRIVHKETRETDCERCGGDGFVVSGFDDDAYENIEDTCPSCSGKGWMIIGDIHLVDVERPSSTKGEQP